ncbi:MAG: RNA-binding protein [Pseudorhodoplanes sp.]|nr:RNA-binding protein [Pseudorhodoplanes sp.]GIK79959.1 MAG: DNA-binding protein [Alphaproteobacteria bacterium]
MLVHAVPDDSDAGPKKAGRERLCALTREVRPVAEMIRFVVGPDGSVVADLKCNLPGRGLWLTGTSQALAEAIKRRVFARGFGQDVRVPADFPDRVETLLEASALDALAIARKAGAVACGFMKVETALADDPVIAVIHAGGAGTDGIRKLDATIRRHGAPDRAEIAVICDFDGSQIDLALGRPNVVHAALLAGPAGNTFIARYLRLKRFRTGGQDNPDAGQTQRKA